MHAEGLSERMADVGEDCVPKAWGPRQEARDLLRLCGAQGQLGQQARRRLYRLAVLLLAIGASLDPAEPATGHQGL